MTDTKIKIPSFLPNLTKAAHDWVERFGVAHVVLAADVVTDPVLLQFRRPSQVEGGYDIIVLNVSTAATGNLQFGDDFMSFNCRFSGKDHQVFLNYEQIMSMYDRDTMAAVGISEYEYALAWFKGREETPVEPVKKKPSLKLVH